MLLASYGYGVLRVVFCCVFFLHFLSLVVFFFILFSFRLRLDHLGLSDYTTVVVH